jgi:hypothetical protein
VELKKKKIRIKKFKARKFTKEFRFIADFKDPRNRVRTLRLLGILIALAAIAIFMISILK